MAQTNQGGGDPFRHASQATVTLGRVLNRVLSVGDADYRKYRELDAVVRDAREQKRVELQECLRLAKWADANLVKVEDVAEYVDPVKECREAMLVEPSFVRGADDPPAVRWWVRVYASPGRLFSFRPLWRLVGSVGFLEIRF